MSEFIKAYQQMIPNEGVDSDDPTDSGGRTVFGISENNWPKWEGRAIVKTLGWLILFSIIKPFE